MTGFFKSFYRFFSKSLHIHFNLSQNVFLSYCLTGWWWLQKKDQLVAKKKMLEGICSNTAYFVYIRSISNIAEHKKSLKFNFFFISKFKLDRVYGKMVNDTRFRVIYIYYIRDTKQQQSTYLMINIADSIPSISSFRGCQW